MSKQAKESARHMISMGLEVDENSYDAPDGTLASGPLLALMSEISPDTGLIEVMRSLARAAEGAADVHAGCDAMADSRDFEMADTVARLKRFSAHIEAAIKEIW